MELLLAVGLIGAFVFAWVYFRGDSSSDGGDGINDRHSDNDDSDSGDSDGGGDGGGD